MAKLGIHLKERVARSGFFFGAVLFHLVLFLMFLGYVVWQAPPPPEPVGFTVIPPAPPKAPVAPANPSPNASGAPSLADSVPLVSPNGTFPAPSAPFSARKAFDPTGDAVNGVSPGTGIKDDVIVDRLPRNPGSPVDLSRVKQIMISREVPGKPGFLRFPIYIAKYADGDWDCNIYLHDGLPASGSLPNLMAKIHEWSHGELDGRQIKVVALDSPEVLSNPPPFIFFTGHKDFHLTEAEVENLRKYLLIGGLLWGDNAFAGDGSRFDVAFHREMKRVLPDADLQFQDVPMDHDIFTPKTHFAIDQVPPGMNRRSDPIQSIDLAGKLAVLYTPNDYSDMMTMLLQPGLNEREAQMDGWNHWTPQHPLFTNAAFVWHSGTYFRNYQPGSSMSAFKLSMNILLRLLHQYDDDVLLTP